MKINIPDDDNSETKKCIVDIRRRSERFRFRPVEPALDSYQYVAVAKKWKSVTLIDNCNFACTYRGSGMRPTTGKPPDSALLVESIEIMDPSDETGVLVSLVA